jgi:tRNA G18 (ribose-2'-O)-methylase SpoU
MANQVVNIPMAAKVESLNVAAAAAICCFERMRQSIKREAS